MSWSVDEDRGGLRAPGIEPKHDGFGAPCTRGRGEAHQSRTDRQVGLPEIGAQCRSVQISVFPSALGIARWFHVPVADGLLQALQPLPVPILRRIMKVDE